MEACDEGMERGRNEVNMQSAQRVVLSSKPYYPMDVQDNDSMHVSVSYRMNVSVVQFNVNDLQYLRAHPVVEHYMPCTHTRIHTHVCVGV